MAGKKQPPVLEGEIVEEKSKATSPKKPAAKKSKQYISEKVVKLAILVLILAALSYWGYPLVKDRLGGLFGDSEPSSATVSGETAPAPDEATGEQATLATPAEEPEVTVQDQKAAPAEEAAISPEADATEPPPAITEEQTTEEQIPEPPATEPPATEPQAAEPVQTSELAAEDTRINDLEAELAALKQSLAQIEATVETPSASFAVAVAELAPLLYQSRPYTGQLEQVRVLILDMPALDQAMLAEPLSALADYSTRGIADLPTLSRDFDAVALQALREEGVSSASGWWARTWARIKGLVVVRRTDGTGGSPLEVAIRQMESDLAAGNVAGVLQKIGTLPADEAAAFRDWATLAGDRVAALQAYNKLVNFVARQTTPVPSPNS